MATASFGSMAEFTAAKRAFQRKWGEKMITGTAEEVAVMTKEVTAMARYSRLRPEKLLWALSQDWTARKGQV